MPCICDRSLTYRFKSTEGQKGDHVATAACLSDDDEDIPANLPVKYVARTERGWKPRDRDKDRMLPILAALSAFTVTIANKMAFSRRARENPVDLLETCGNIDSEVLSRNRSDPSSRLEDYLLALLCSRTPSHFRTLERPDDLLPRPRPSLSGSLCNVPRAWATDIVGVNTKSIKTDPGDPDSSEDSARGRWTTLIRSWKMTRQQTFATSISDAFEPMPAGDEHCLEDELACFRAAVDEAGYLREVDEPFSSAFVAIERDAMSLMCADVDRRGPDFLLQSAEAAIQGLSSYRRLWHSMERAFAEHR